MNFIQQFESLLDHFEKTESYSDLQKDLKDIQAQCSEYFSLISPQSLIKEYTRELSNRLLKLKETNKQEQEDSSSESSVDESDNESDKESDKESNKESDKSTEAKAKSLPSSNISVFGNMELPETLGIIYRDKAWKDKTQDVYHLVIEHLTREGMTQEAALLSNALGIQGEKETFEKILKFQPLIDSLKKRNPEPTLQWCRQELQSLAELKNSAIKSAMEESSMEDSPMEDTSYQTKLYSLGRLSDSIENLMFRIFRLEYIRLLLHHGKDVGSIVQFARENFAPFSRKKIYMKEISMLMGALLYADKLSGSPYAHLEQLNYDKEWDILVDTFIDILYTRYEIPKKSPLKVSILAGMHALPHLMRQASILKANLDEEEWEEFCNADQLSVRTPLSEDLHFQNIFTCPVSQEIATPDNPPVLLPCGHVLCKSSVTRIVSFRGVSQCKCPYCQSAEFKRSKCQELNFG